MNPTPPHIPPQWPLRLLRFFLKEDYLEEIEGDMEEIFQENLEELGKKKAHRRYVLDTVKLFRLSLIKHISLPTYIIPYSMIRHNLLISFRNALRYQGTFLINLMGLSAGLASVLLIYLWLQDELAIDTFNEHDKQIFQVLRNVPNPSGVRTHEWTPGLLGEALETKYPEVEKAVTVHGGNWETKGIISFGDTKLEANERYVSRKFFEVFSFDLLQGDKKTALYNPNSVILSKELAEKLFGSVEKAMGQTIEWTREQRGRDFGGLYQVAGVIKKEKHNVSLPFDLLFTFESYKDRNVSYINWSNNSQKTYLLMREGSDISAFEAKIAPYLHTHIDKDWVGTLLLQAFSKRYLFNRFENGKQAGGRVAYLYLFGLIGLFILGIACINFMNLATARATRRMKEIGVKKAMGIQRKSLVLQFLMESILISFLSLGIGLLMASVFLPFFNTLTEKNLNFPLSFSFLLSLLGMALGTGLLAGSYPSIYLSRLSPAGIFRGNIKLGIKDAHIRKGLVIFQFVISIILMIAVGIVYKQLDWIQHRNLGYEKNQIVSINNEGSVRKNIPEFMAKIEAIPGVQEVAAFDNNFTGRHSGAGNFDWEGKDPSLKLHFNIFRVDYGLIELMELELAAGRSFDSSYGGDSAKIIFNQAAIQAMGMDSPLGKTFQLWGQKMEIIGVVKDFHYESFYEAIEPCFFLYSPERKMVHTLVKIQLGKEQEVLEKIALQYTELSGGLPLTYNFLDDEFQKMYASERRIKSLFTYFAALAILISCMGLLGLAIFTSESRKKEIGIRKILGSSTYQLLRLLTDEFSKTVGIAILIAMPIAYLMAQYWLDSFAFKTSLHWGNFLGPGILALLIAWTTVGLQTIQAAQINPVECLIDE